MVASGFFPDSTAVAPVRLVIHLALALILYAALLWTGLAFWTSRREGAREEAGTTRGVRGLAGVVVACVALTIVAGGFVAGLHAGKDYNTFPLMEGRIVPRGYAALTPFMRNLIENVATVQFDHRLLATATALLSLLTVAVGLVRGARGAARTALLCLGAAVCAQYALGVATLVHVVPIDLAVTHQAMAVMLLTAALLTLHTQREAAPR
jgi:cytochrome c oxidase assembly protein subunit 15